MGKMKTLVTGGAGFIGSHLARRLAELGHEVKVFDLPSAIPYWNNGRSINGVTYHVRDITQPALHDFRCDWCFHLAARADVIPSIENPYSYHRANVDGTVNILDHCVRLGVKKLIFASSTSIYGIPKQYPTPETALADPCYPYALTKYVAEQYVMHWGRVYKLPVVSLRITTAYGPGMKSGGMYGSVFKVFLPQKANRVPYTITGNGSESRDFVFIDDIVDAFIRTAESDVQGQIFNVGSGEPIEIKRLTELLGDDNGIVYLPRRPGEPIMTWADISKIKKMLGWEPQVSIEQGVKVMLNHLNDWKNETVWTPEMIEKATREWYKFLGEESASRATD